MTVTQKCDDWSHCLFKNQTWEQCCQLFLLPADDVCLLSTTLVIHRDTFIHRYTYRLQNKNFHPKNPNTLWRKRARFVQGFKKKYMHFYMEGSVRLRLFDILFWKLEQTSAYFLQSRFGVFGHRFIISLSSASSFLLVIFGLA